jgi:hypothetical protein
MLRSNQNLKTLRFVCGISGVILCKPVSAAIVIGFDDRPGLTGFASVQGQPVPPAYVIHDEYLPLGVRFDSGGGGVALVRAINAVSPTNVALATEPGPVMSFNEPVKATFFLSNGAPAVVDMVALTLTSTSGNSRFKAFDRNGVLLGSVMAGPGSTLQLVYSNQIHSVELDQGSFSFDDFTFSGLAAAFPGATLDIRLSGSNVILNWTQGMLQEADTTDGTYTNVTGAISPFYVTPSAGRKFYRLQIQ